MHDVYCFQLERFLCRDCGKVKCGCEAPDAINQHTAPPAEANQTDDTTEHNLTKSDTVEYRKPNTLARQNSGPESSEYLQKRPPLSYRSSEQPFVRSPQGENGKLRRSFAVRSREGLENLLSFASIKKSDPGKMKQLSK